MQWEETANEPEVHNKNDTIESSLANTETVKSDFKRVEEIIKQNVITNASQNESSAFLVNTIGSKMDSISEYVMKLDQKLKALDETGNHKEMY